MEVYDIIRARRMADKDRRIGVVEPFFSPFFGSVSESFWLFPFFLAGLSHQRQWKGCKATHRVAHPINTQDGDPPCNRQRDILNVPASFAPSWPASCWPRLPPTARRRRPLRQPTGRRTSRDQPALPTWASKSPATATSRPTARKSTRLVMSSPNFQWSPRNTRSRRETAEREASP